MTQVIFQPHPGPQTMFAQWDGYYGFFAGAAGPGKTECLRWDPWKQIQGENERLERGEIKYSIGRAILFRRTMPELREIIDRCARDFNLIDPGANWHEQTKTWTMSCGYKYMFGQMEDPGDWIKYYSFEFTWCVEVGTRVRMADGSLWPIEKIRPGDMVLTLEGPRPVVSLSAPRTKSCIQAVVRHQGAVLGVQVHPVDHPVLTTASTTHTGTRAYTPGTEQDTSVTPSWLSYESLLSESRGSLAGSASSTSAGSDFAASGDSLPAASQLPTLSVPVVLYAPQSLSAAQADAQANAQGRSRLFLRTYLHPYTKEERPVSADLSGDIVLGSCSMTPVGWRSVVDITIAGASHYFTESGLINRNCGFDELTTFTEEQFDQLDTRLRSKDPVLHAQRCMRAASNPVGPGLEWVRRRFVELGPANTPLLVRVPVTVIKPDGSKSQEIEERSQIFIPARLQDNPSIDYKSYAATLASKSPTTRRQLLEGDWYVSAGSCFGELWDQDIHVCKPFKIPSGWFKFRSGDYGYRWPGLSSVQWWAVDTDGNFTCYRSMTVHGMNHQELASSIRDVEMEAGEWDMPRDCSKLSGPLDYSCWGETGHTGPTIAEGMINQGVFWEKCDKGREAAAEQIRMRLARRTKHPTAKGVLVPGIRWFNTCWNWVRVPGGKKVKVGPIITIPVLPADEIKPDCWDTKANDHDADSAGYACLSRPLIPETDVAVETVDDDDELAARRRRNKRPDSAWASGGYF